MKENMVLLQTLGKLYCEASDYNQPKGLLLLAYVLLEGQQHRATLARLFWPHQDKARENLSTTLYKIKQGFPLDIVMADKNYVGLRDTIVTDVDLLHEALEQHQTQNVSRLYKGAFCKDIQIQGINEELEEWLYKTREAIAHKVQRYLLNSAKLVARQGDWQQAADLAFASYQVEGLAALSLLELQDIYQYLEASNHPQKKQLEEDMQDLGDYALNLQKSSPMPLKSSYPNQNASIAADNPSSHFVADFFTLQEMTSFSYRSETEKKFLKNHYYEIITVVFRENALYQFINDVLNYLNNIHKIHPDISYIIIDCEHLNYHDHLALRKLVPLQQELAARAITLIFSSAFLSQNKHNYSYLVLHDDSPTIYPNRDRALEYCENLLLARHFGANKQPPACNLLEFPLLQRLRKEEILTVKDFCQPSQHEAHSFIIQATQPDSALYFLTRGIVDITLGNKGQPSKQAMQRKRINQQIAGSVFGELAFLNTTTRTANVEAVTDCECFKMDKASAETLRQQHPDIHYKLSQEFNELLVHRVKYLTSLR